MGSAVQRRKGHPDRALIVALPLPRGFPAAWLPALGSSPYASAAPKTIYEGELELLLPRGLSYRVKKVVRDRIVSEDVGEIDSFIFVTRVHT
jgi:hypothetical protein